jgi:putative selenium metabolism protein SsnA
LNGILLSGGPLATSYGEAEVFVEAGVVWNDGRIVAVGPEEDLKREFPDAERLDARGGLILPGLVNVHHHFYSALARGLDPGVAMANFSEILQGLWWRLDRALDLEAVEVSALLSLADCIRSGCTTVFDHHASPSAISTSLSTIAAAVESAGLRAMLCYEVSDRNGRAEADLGIEENLDFILSHHKHATIRGMVGLHASFTVDDISLKALSELRPEGIGCHIHLAEDIVDVTDSVKKYGARPLARLADFDLLDKYAILVHGVHLDESELRRVAASGATLVHNPESNQNNGVGRLELPNAASLGCRLALGTDGMSSAMLRSLRSAFLGLRGARQDPTLGFDVVPDLLSNNAGVAAQHFDEENLGRLVPGAPADIIVVDCAPPTKLSAENLFGHLVYGASEYPVRHTIAGGRVLLRDFEHLTIDIEGLSARARRISPAVWKRFREIS